MRFLLALIAAALLALGAAACGSDDGGSDESDVPGGADPESVQVIDEWATALADGDVEGAADYFSVPSVASNGTPPVELETRDDVIAFNEALPCGAELVEAVQEERFVIATFELTERPGEGECGEGVGVRANTAFVIVDGKIVEWRRAPNDPSVEPPTDQPVV